ncbi:hypothetical protein U5801_00505 [Lamprobacter modestohalophilus]|uniref:hypothetical protein n=1 Tax=Lamprobacter modestohalophilus TaxID=1064514 RepID=UPI002ADEB526|nr:hypothetical protein [Lamprobacter modestohalophilus]MEA1048304.1 hypothetical protein [Lamprobacter modestohalophilus]
MPERDALRAAGECGNEQQTFGPLSLRVRPLLQGNAEHPQLCAPSAYAEPGDDLSDCRLFSIVAWDQVSWPGNDYWGGARMTDDEVKAAASDLMCAITGTEGADEARSSGYQPPAPCASWLASQADAHAVAGASRRRLRSTSV